MKCVKKIVRHYWKYVDWEQPILTSNTGNPELQVSAGNERSSNAYVAFDGNTSPNSGWTTENYVTSSWLKAKINKKLYISQIRVMNRYADSGWRTKTVEINGETKTFENKQEWVTFTYNSYFTTDEITFNVTGNGWTGICEVEITAKYAISGTSTDYDFYTDDEIALLPTKIIRHYWKYEESVFNLPTFSSETEALEGKNGVKIDIGSAWRSIGQEYVYSGIPNTDGFAYITFIFEGLGKINTITYRGQGASDQCWEATLKGFEAYDEDTSSWIELVSASIGTSEQTLTIPTPKYYKRYRIKYTGNDTVHYSICGLAKILMNGYIKILVEGTPTDYDFYTDDETFLGINQ